jgi:hypothetical protein
MRICEYLTMNRSQLLSRNPTIENISADEYFRLKKKHLNTIGNLTLSGNNGALVTSHSWIKKFK